MRRIVVCDTGPLLHLSEAGIMHLLELAGEIYVPPVVKAEFDKNSTQSLPGRIKIQAAQYSLAPGASEKIDAGELEAIQLAREIDADWLLTDDTLARRFAETLHLEAHGSIGLLLWAVAAGHVENREQAHQYLKALADSSLWISQRILQKARAAIDSLLPE